MRSCISIPDMHILIMTGHVVGSRVSVFTTDLESLLIRLKTCLIKILTHILIMCMMYAYTYIHICVWGGTFI